jgi:L-iditol 2-dehydrogenase
MRYLLCPRTNVLEVMERERPGIEAGDLLVEMRACGICGTDVMKVYDAATPKPVQLGHEVVAIVRETGAGVTRFRPGERVAVAHHAPDFSSHFTRRGSAPMDPAFKASNIDPGGFAEFIRVPAALVPHTVVAVPEAMSDLRAVFMEPLACCLRALDRAPVIEGDTVLIVGAGAIGVLFVPLLRDRSATILAADVRPERLQLAMQWGATATFAAGADDVAAGARHHSGGRGADLVILTVANQSTLATALSAVRDGGTVLLFGVKPGTEPPVDLWQLFRREINLISSYSTTPDLLARAMAILRRNEYALEALISHQLPLAEAQHGFALLHQGKASKVIITRS